MHLGVRRDASKIIHWSFGRFPSFWYLCRAAMVSDGTTVIWFLGRVVRHRTANPLTAVRIRQEPQMRSELFFRRVRFFFLQTVNTKRACFDEKFRNIEENAYLYPKYHEALRMTMERLLITCANNVLTQHFKALYSDAYDMRFLTTKPVEENEFYWDPMQEELDPDALEGVDHIIHLAGALRLPQKVDVRGRNILHTYRAGAIALIGRMLMARGQKVKSIITASSYYYYGSEYSPYIFTEHNKPGKDFYATLDQAAEEESYILQVEKLADRAVYPRFGNIFCHYAGLLPHIAMGSSCGLSIAYGLGRQVIPWVHINDACRTLDHMIRNEEMTGAYNCVAPEWISYREISEMCAKLRSGNVIPLHLPSACLRMIYGRYAEHFLRSRRISMTRLLNSGFEFKYPDFLSALLNIYDFQGYEG